MANESWKNERYFSTFEEADTLRKSLLHRDGTLQVKVKRCGFEGTQYVVKSRVNPELKATIEQVEEQMLIAKEKKSKKK